VRPLLVELNYLSTHKAVDVGPLLLQLSEEAQRTAPERARVKVCCDWVQYQHNFRQPVQARPAVSADGTPLEEGELAVDVRRIGNGADTLGDLQTCLAALVAGTVDDSGIVLEDFGPLSRSVVWSFNRLFWDHLSSWEAAFASSFVDALPGGVSDGTNPAFWAEQIDGFVAVLDDLRDRRQLPDELFVLELGVGSGQQAKVWLDTFQAVCRERQTDYYDRLHYLMTDASSDVLRTARAAVAAHEDRVSQFGVDATDPRQALAFLRYKVLFIHASNLYDNLPTDEIVRRDGRIHEVHVRARLPAAAVRSLAADHGLDVDELPVLLERLLRVGPDCLPDRHAGVRFWCDLWRALRLDERHVRLEDPPRRIAAGAAEIDLEELLGHVEGDIRMHVSNAALASFANTLPLLHPRGRLQVLDLFVDDLAGYQGPFRGPGKLDGSIVNWLNGPLFRLVSERLGYHMNIERFRHRDRSRISVLSTTPKD
jgi:hypothetical protein